MKNKTCRKCNKELSLDSFSKDRNDCKGCRVKYVLSWRIKTNYQKKYRQRLKEQMPWRLTFDKINERCKSHPYYKNKRITTLTVNDLKYLWFRDKGFLLRKPSIDRINNNGNYTLDNCRYIEHSENSRKGILETMYSCHGGV